MEPITLAMEPISLLFLGLGAWTSYYVISCVVAWYRLRKIPGPLLASFSYLWLARLAGSGRQYYIHRELCKQYGPLVRVGPNELTTDDPEVIRKMSATRSSYRRDPWYLGARFNPYQVGMFTTLDPEAHDRLKAQMAGAYSGRESPALESGVDAQVETLMDIIRQKYLWSPATKQAPLLDLSQLMSFFTLDVITRAGFGREFGYLREESDLYNFLSGIRHNWPRMAISLDVPAIRKVLYSPLFLRFFGPKHTDKEGLGALMGVAKKAVVKRFESTAKSEGDMLSYFINHGLSQADCEVEGLFMITAGSDTTAGALRTTLLYIMTCPRVYQKLKEEIARTVSEGRASSPIAYEEARRIPYLQAVIYEGLRMRPPAPGLYLKSVPPKGDVIHGQFIPGGTAIGMNTSSLMCSTAYFGPDADVFRPERFMEADDATRAEMERLVELVFGYGKWMCAGKSVAFMELNKVCFELLRAFDLQVARPTKPWDSQSWSVFVEQNMWVKVTEASHA